jgi:hypothetical protein
MTSRRKFLTGAVVLPLLGYANLYAQDKKPDPLANEVVKEFVRLGHFDLKGVTQMLEEKASVLNATYDWGGGDFETALGGASHVGNKDIANYLISKGARLDIFTAAMLDKVELVRSMIDAFPAALQCIGPHGIPLLKHAQKGEAVNVIEYLKTKGITG